MLKIENVRKVFNENTVNEKVAIKNLNLKINEGDFVTVIGGNGAGKSTLLNLIAGVYPLSGGEIFLDSKNISLLAEHQRAKHIGRVFQDPLMGSAADMEIIENLALANKRSKKRRLKFGISPGDRKLFSEKVKQLDLGLESRLNTKVGLLSGGQRQALTLLMATLDKPKLLLLDEHTAALDPKIAKKVLNLTDDLIKADNITTFMVTHNMRDAIEHGNRLIMMHDGEIILDIAGQEKANLTINDLLLKFEESTSEHFSDDSALLVK